jgi:prepilin-type N-terminal cleavage/methylation domain-containing protein
MHKRYLHGFTLVELSVVIVVIALMTSVGMIAYTSAQVDTRDSRREADMAILVNELEKFYDKKGEYPPGCPDTSCPSTMHTTNTSSAILTPNTTLTTLTSILPGVKTGLGDPQSLNKTLPFKNRTVAEKKYYYYGGTVNYTGATTTLTFATHANFPCSIRSSLLAGEVGSYVIGYFDEKTSTWILTGGRNGVPMTVTAGTCVINRA